jgi:nitroreductase
MDDSGRLRDLVRQATLAASSHNTQPWTFALAERSITIRPDSRAEPPWSIRTITTCS